MITNHVCRPSSGLFRPLARRLQRPITLVALIALSEYSFAASRCPRPHGFEGEAVSNGYP
jgi:hypothetical protein